MRGKYFWLSGIRVKFFLALMVMAVLMSKPALAHERNYVFNQEYRTIPQGMFEIEGQTTFEMPDHHMTNENEFEYQGELEYGVTDHWTIAHYEKWQTENQAGLDDDGLAKKDSTRYTGFKFETKHRLGEKGKYWVDPLLYLEWATNPNDHETPNTIEGKVVLSKDFDKFNVTYNQIMESGLGKQGRTEHEFTLGMNYEALEGFHVGVEVEGDYWKPSSRRNEIAMGPTVAYATKYFWVATGFLFGVNHAAADVEARIVFGIPIG